MHVRQVSPLARLAVCVAILALGLAILFLQDRSWQERHRITVASGVRTALVDPRSAIDRDFYTQVGRLRQLARDSTIPQIYPTPGNEPAMGLELLADPGGSWQFAALPQNGWNRLSPASWPWLLGVLALAAGLAISTVMLWRKVARLTAANQTLRQRIAERESAEEAYRKSQKQAEASLRESESLTRSMLAALPDLMFQISPEGIYQSVHAPDRSILYVDPETIVGNHISDLLPPDVVPAILEAFEETRESESITVVEYALDFTPEDRHYFEARLVPCGDDILGLVRDITERKRSEIERERFRGAMEQVIESIIITATDGTIEYVNPAFERTTGYSRDEVVGRHVKILRGDKHDDAYFDMLWDTIYAGNTWRGQFVNRRKDGTLYTSDATVSPVVDGEGHTLNFISVQRDITREQELEHMLMQAQKVESLGTLAGGIAHDFNNILQAVMGYTGMAKMYVGDPDELEPLKFCVQEIESGIERAAELVGQILTFSRKAEVSKEVLSLESEIDHAFRFLRRSIPVSVRIERRISPGCARVLANSNQVHQLLTNLCTNAMHAMERQGGTLTVTLDPVVLNEGRETLTGTIPAGAYTRLGVEDTGDGIPPDVFPRLLDPFFTTKEVGKGTGLGLPIVHGILSAMGGGLEIETTPGEGTSVKAFFPCAPPESHTAEPRTMPSTTSSETGRVLAVDDEDSITRFLDMLLSAKGFTVESHSHGEAALASFAAGPERFDIAIIDLTMPGMSGLDLARELAAIRPELPVLLATGNIQPEILTKERSPNVVQIIQKPFKPVELLEIMSRYLRPRP